MPNDEQKKQIKAEIKRVRAEMRQGGVRVISFMNAGITPEERGYNARLFKLKSQLDGKIPF